MEPICYPDRLRDIRYSPSDRVLRDFGLDDKMIQSTQNLLVYLTHRAISDREGFAKIREDQEIRIRVK